MERGPSGCLPPILMLPGFRRLCRNPYRRPAPAAIGPAWGAFDEIRHSAVPDCGCHFPARPFPCLQTAHFRGGGAIFLSICRRASVHPPKTHLRASIRRWGAFASARHHPSFPVLSAGRDLLPFTLSHPPEPPFLLAQLRTQTDFCFFRVAHPWLTPSAQSWPSFGLPFADHPLSHPRSFSIYMDSLNYNSTISRQSADPADGCRICPRKSGQCRRFFSR